MNSHILGGGSVYYGLKSIGRSGRSPLKLEGGREAVGFLARSCAMFFPEMFFSYLAVHTAFQFLIFAFHHTLQVESYGLIHDLHPKNNALSRSVEGREN
jgi:hypothetical protein